MTIHRIHKANEYCAIYHRGYSKSNNFYWFTLLLTDLRNTTPDSTTQIEADNRFSCILPLFGPPVALNEGIMQREGARMVQQHQASHSVKPKMNWSIAGPNYLQVAKTVIYSPFSLFFLIKFYQPKQLVTQNCKQKIKIFHLPSVVYGSKKGQ